MRITAITHAADARAQNLVDEFAAALAAAIGAPVEVVVGTLADAPADGYIVAFGSYGLRANRALGPRIVLIDADGAHVGDQLERYRLAGAVDHQRYFQWKYKRDREDGRGLIGRKDVAAAIGAAITGSYDTERYGTLSAPACADLPSLVAAYLAGYERAPALPVPPSPAPGQRTVDDGRIFVGDPIDAGTTSGLYRGHVAGEPRKRRLVTISPEHDDAHDELSAALSLPVEGVTPLAWIGGVDEPDDALWRGDAMVEIEPDGVPASTVAPMPEPAAIRLATAVAAIAARTHAAGLVLDGIRPELIYVKGDGERATVTAIAPRAARFIRSAQGDDRQPALAALYERETLTGRAVTAASDVFALCATVFELVAGFHPFGPVGEQFGRLAAADPLPWPGSAALGAILAAGFAGDPERRPTAAELAKRLAALG